MHQYIALDDSIYTDIQYKSSQKTDQLFFILAFGSLQYIFSVTFLLGKMFVNKDPAETAATPHKILTDKGMDISLAHCISIT